MKSRKLKVKSVLTILISFLLILSVPIHAAGREIYLDFAGYPDGPARTRGIRNWNSSGTDKNPYYENSLRLLYQGSTLTAKFYLESSPRQAELKVTHLSSKSETCPGNGYSPVTISINERTLVRNYDVAKRHGGSHGYEMDMWGISQYLHQGINEIEWRAENLCTHYWLKRFEINTTGYPHQQGNFSGRWVNVNSNTEGITRLTISSDQQGRNVRAFGQCHPEDCDWGETQLHLLGDNVTEEKPSLAIARWEHGYANKTLILHFSEELLVAECFTAFQDNSGRSNYRSTYRFQRKY